ncbi:MAG TPA: hypothetical protein VMT53_04070 [Terriglobales bacterium]|nr:hypothetical protein [Terriglobales bacterium]
MAEVTLAHIRQLAVVFGCAVSEEEVLRFLNENGHAYALWMSMMQAAEDFIKSNLPTGRTKADTRQAKHSAFTADTCHFPTYQTNADGMSDLNNNLRI